MQHILYIYVTFHVQLRTARLVKIRKESDLFIFELINQRLIKHTVLRYIHHICGCLCSFVFL